MAEGFDLQAILRAKLATGDLSDSFAVATESVRKFGEQAQQSMGQVNSSLLKTMTQVSGARMGISALGEVAGQAATGTLTLGSAATSAGQAMHAAGIVGGKAWMSLLGPIGIAVAAMTAIIAVITAITKAEEERQKASAKLAKEREEGLKQEENALRDHYAILAQLHADYLSAIGKKEESEEAQIEANRQTAVSRIEDSRDSALEASKERWLKERELAEKAGTDRWKLLDEKEARDAEINARAVEQIDATNKTFDAKQQERLRKETDRQEAAIIQRTSDEQAYSMEQDMLGEEAAQKERDRQEQLRRDQTDADQAYSMEREAALYGPEAVAAREKETADLLQQQGILQDQVDLARLREAAAKSVRDPGFRAQFVGIGDMARRIQQAAGSRAPEEKTQEEIALQTKLAAIAARETAGKLDELTRIRKQLSDLGYGE